MSKKIVESGRKLILEKYKEDIFQSILNLINHNFGKDAKKLISDFRNSQNWSGAFTIEKKRIHPIYYLYTLYLYSKSLDEKIIKENLPQIKKSVNFLKKSFDSHYLLFSSFSDEGKRIFTYQMNNYLLDSIEYFIEKLEELKEDKAAHSLIDIKNKLELGFDKYLNQKSSKIKVSWFSPDDNSYEMEKKVKVDKREYRVLEIIKDKTLLKKYLIHLNNFPEKIYETNKLPLDIKAETSLFYHTRDEQETKKIGKYTLDGINSLKVANALLKVLKNDKK